MTIIITVCPNSNSLPVPPRLPQILSNLIFIIVYLHVLPSLSQFISIIKPSLVRLIASLDVFIHPGSDENNDQHNESLNHSKFSGFKIVLVTVALG